MGAPLVEVAVLRLYIPHTVFFTSVFVDKQWATSTIHPMAFLMLQMASTPTTLKVTPSCMVALVDIFGHTPVDSLMDDNYVSGYNCPCAKYPGRNPPAFVGLDYYCESGITGRWQDNRRIALEDPLWDGDGYGPGNNWYTQAGMPWFCRNLPQEVSEDIEVRICASSPYNSDEEVYLDLLEIHIQ